MMDHKIVVSGKKFRTYLKLLCDIKIKRLPASRRRLSEPTEWNSKSENKQLMMLAGW